MNLTSVKYQDSCIYIGLEGSKEREILEKSLKGIKNVYAVYKIKAYDNYVRDTILIREEDITIVRGEIVVKFELNQLHRPDECEIEIISLKFTYYGGNRAILAVNRSYPLREIRAHSPIATKNKIDLKKNNFRPVKMINRDLSMTQEVIVPEELKRLRKIADQVNQDEFIVINEITPLSTAVFEIESKMESRIDAQSKKLEIDITQLCYETIDLLLTSLPQSELAEEYRASNAMVRSIHRYINVDLLQKELEEGERA